MDYHSNSIAFETSKIHSTFSPPQFAAIPPLPTISAQVDYHRVSIGHSLSTSTHLANESPTTQPNTISTIPSPVILSETPYMRTTIRAQWVVSALLHLVAGACLGTCEALLLAEDLSPTCLLAGLWAAVAALVLAALCGREATLGLRNAAGGTCYASLL